MFSVIGAFVIAYGWIIFKDPIMGLPVYIVAFIFGYAHLSCWIYRTLNDDE